ncbi:MAG: putative oxidoreductase [bacterium]
MYIFTQVGLEPNGRIAIGVLELILAILILIPKTTWIGAGLTMGIIGGAIMMHLTQLGIVIKGDSGLLFYTAVVTFVLSAIVLWSVRKSIPFWPKSA